ncbi:hypothetical protein VB834_15085 [Limnoraphis robusta Tam1]|uniref:hypothetical protein n=1 Tax=Limnoraphis robusta TaxID=1118279 RepID=UPI002B20B8F6|nr:hypothetical protein [Limnoraphis robusta]MEA5498323.1 hypothetical protein [Limnoraphis robusta BA-68 BA1]MEA5540348.1 hypothetical protein [Limnoraphis robusta Tam1]
MTGWYTITPTGPITIGNLTPVGQNSGQVGCRWPPNGHQLAACLNLPSHAQLWGPFWYCDPNLYVLLPLPVYTLDIAENRASNELPQRLYRLVWDEQEQWQVQSQHQGQEIEVIGGQYLIPINTLEDFWRSQEWSFSSGKPDDNELKHLPWKTLTLSHNSREDFQVKDEGGFFAEMTTLLDPDWSILVKIIGEYEPPNTGILGAGTPVTVRCVRGRSRWEKLGAECPNPREAILLTGALWQQPQTKLSCPTPPGVKGYAAEMGVPWQSWKKVRDRHDPTRRVAVLTPGEWMTPAGAVYLWAGTSPVSYSGPLPDPFNRHVLGYGHLWLF